MGMPGWKREAASCLKADKSWEDVEEEGRAGWSMGRKGIQLSWPTCFRLTLMAESSGCHMPALIRWLCSLETVRNVYWKQGKPCRLGWIES